MFLQHVGRLEAKGIIIVEVNQGVMDDWKSVFIADDDHLKSSKGLRNPQSVC